MRWDATIKTVSLGRWRLDSILIQLGQRSFLLTPLAFISCQEVQVNWEAVREAFWKKFHSRPPPSVEEILLARSNEVLDDMTRPHNMIASPGTLNERSTSCLKYFHNVVDNLGKSGNRYFFIWTAKAVADLHAAIRVAGLEGKPLLQANVPEVAALFLKSPSGKGCNEIGGARVLPAFVLIPVPFSPSLALSSVALTAPL